MADPEGSADEQRIAAEEDALDAAQDDAEAERVERNASNGRFGPGNSFRFRPGQSGNPEGRPKGVTALFREVSESIHPQDPEGREVMRLIALALANKALKGNVQAAREFLDRAHGRVPLSVRLGADADEGESLTDIRVRLVTAGEVQQAKRVSAKPVSGNGNGNGNG
jgi:hypothetical protein